MDNAKGTNDALLGVVWKMLCVSRTHLSVSIMSGQSSNKQLRAVIVPHKNAEVLLDTWTRKPKRDKKIPLNRKKSRSFGLNLSQEV